MASPPRYPHLPLYSGTAAVHPSGRTAAQSGLEAAKVRLEGSHGAVQGNFWHTILPVLGLRASNSHSRRRTRLLLFLGICVLTTLAFLHKSQKVSSWRTTGASSLPGMLNLYGEEPESTTGKNGGISTALQPLTELGFAADAVYEAVGSVDKTIYRRDLEDFLRIGFPARESDPLNPDSLLSILHDFIPPPKLHIKKTDPQRAAQAVLLLPFQVIWNGLKDTFSSKKAEVSVPAREHTIPKTIHQTSWYPGNSPPGDKLGPRTWSGRNVDHLYRYYDDNAAKAFVEEAFNASLVLDGHGARSLQRTYEYMKDIPVMQSDFWRYSILANEGGVYSDLDTICLKSISSWHRPPFQRNDPPPLTPDVPVPSIIVGIEQDVGTRADWHDWWPRPLGIAQWTIASTRGHPILLDVLRRITDSVNPASATDGKSPESSGGYSQGNRKLDAVVEQTGPGPWTDSILRYLGVKYNTTWPALRSLPSEGMLFTDPNTGYPDVLVLSVTGFSPGIGQFGAGDLNAEAALVRHLFSGSWKAKNG